MGFSVLQRSGVEVVSSIVVFCVVLSSVVVTSVVLSELEVWLPVVVTAVEPQCYALVGFELFSPYCMRQALVR